MVTIQTDKGWGVWGHGSSLGGASKGNSEPVRCQVVKVFQGGYTQ